MDNFSKYVQMQNMGTDAQSVYLAAKADGIDAITCIRLLREVFQFSLVEAKDVIILADEMSSSLNEYQGHLKSDIEKALDTDKPPNNANA